MNKKRLRPAKLPLTRVAVSHARAGEIRAAVRAAAALPGAEGLAPSRLAQLADAEALTSFLALPDIHTPIYTLPNPVTFDAVSNMIETSLAARSRGEGLLFVRYGGGDQIVGFSELEVWPHWGAGELGGALHPDMQSQGAGARGAAATFDWMFETLGLELICETAALDNVRTARLLDHLGFERKGEIMSERPDGGLRPSRVWELSRDDWRAQRRQA